MRKHLQLLFAIGLIIALPPAGVLAQEGGSTGSGDLFGDLVHIKRSPETGQPILQKRWIEYPKDVLDWGYCPIPVDAAGNEIPFAPLSCDADPAFEDALVEVDYFGRLSGSRTRERNIRMHFDEVISKIKEGQVVTRDAAGRLMIGSACAAVEGGGIDAATCTWKTVDSPLENTSVYHRVLKYGHIQTDPLEIDVDFHGDPALPTQYHPALDASDYAKFQGPLIALLPTAPDSAGACFGGGTFTCDDPQALASDDFAIAASLLGGAADKTGTITMDLVQYLHRILKIPVATTSFAATVNTLPALIRDCGADPDNQVPAYSCTIYPAPGGLPAPGNERFVDYAAAQYDRTLWFSGTTDALKPTGVDTWALATGIVMRDYLSFANPGHQAGTNIEAFVNAALDGIRAVEFMHEYEPPADLGWDFSTVYPDPTTLSLAGLTADPAAPQPIGRTIRFTATASGGLAPLGYKWLLFDGLYWTTLKAWSTANTLDWTPAVENPDYRIGVWVRNGDSTVDAPDNPTAVGSLAYPIEAGVQVTSLTANLPSPQAVGTAIQFTATAVGGTPPYEYKWWLFNGSAWVILQTWTASSTVTWTPTVANAAYRIGVWVRSAGNLVDATEGAGSYASIAFPITAAAPLTITAFTPSLPAPQPVGTAIQFTVTAVGGTAPYEYKWWLFDGSAWTVLQTWTASATFTWIPAAANPAYRIGVWVRSAGSTLDATEGTGSYTSLPFPVAPAP